MPSLRPARPFLLTLLLAAGTAAQCVPPQAACGERPQEQALQFKLQVPRGTPLQVALQERVRVRAVGSPVFATVIGAYGAALSIHRNFLGRGRDVALPVPTPLEISFGKPRPAPDREDPDH